MSSQPNTLFPRTPGGKLLAGTALVECLALVIFNAVIFTANVDRAIADILVSIFMLFLALRAQLTQNAMLMFSHVALNFLLFIRAAISARYIGTSQSVYNTMPILCFVTIIFSQISLTYAAVLNFKDWRWSVIDKNVDIEDKGSYGRHLAYELYKVLTWHTYHFIAFFVISSITVVHRSIWAIIVVLVGSFVIGAIALQSHALRANIKWLLWVLVFFNLICLLISILLPILMDVASALELGVQGIARVPTSMLFWVNLIVPIYIAQFALSLVSFHRLPAKRSQGTTEKVEVLIQA